MPPGSTRILPLCGRFIRSARARGGSQTVITWIETCERRIDIVALVTLCEVLIFDAAKLVQRLKGEIERRQVSRHS